MNLMLLSTLCAGVAVLLALPPPADRGVGSRPRSLRTARARTSAGTLGLLLMVPAVVSVAAAVLAGPAASVVATAVTTVAVVVGILIGRHVGAGRAAAARSQVARACSAVAAQVRVGRIPADALVSAAIDHPVLDRPARTSGLGGDVVAALRAEAVQPGRGGLAQLARAWQFSFDTGAPMADVLDQVAVALRAEQAVQRTVRAELAGPRASGVVMAVLPLFGIGMGYLIGGDPLHFLIEGPPGWGCLLGGVALALAGVLWIDRLSSPSAAGTAGVAGGTAELIGNPAEPTTGSSVATTPATGGPGRGGGS